MMSPRNPFIAGNWVRGDNFFGRKALVREILEGNRQCVWVAGPRRFGKTSLLKQLEYLTLEGEYKDRLVALFWDMQGSSDAAGLQESLLESVEDASERFTALGVDLSGLEGTGVPGILRQLRRAAEAAGQSLLLLCDEAEELVTVEKNDPEILPRLRRFTQNGRNCLTVLTATRRLGKLSEAGDSETSPFLHGFLPPIYLPQLSDDEASRLIRKGGFPAAQVAEIISATNKHPYLLQLVCKRLFETGDLAAVIEELSLDDLVSHFFAVDFQILSADEREVLVNILHRGGCSVQELEQQFPDFGDRIVRLVYELVQLGFVRQEQGGCQIANYFFARWLEREKETFLSQSALTRAIETPHTPRNTGAAQVMPAAGSRLGHHEVREEIGVGGMGVVYKALDIDLQRTVALKVLRPWHVDDPEFRQRFLLEARATSSMNHPNVTTIYEVGEQDGLCFISMEYVDGQTLRQWQQTHARDLAAQLHLAIQAAAGLAHAHEMGIVHRDIKPENIMVSATDERVKVMDFGLAKIVRGGVGSHTRSGTTLGTLSYMSPEQASGLKVDHRTDIFSFGVVLYELFSGELPFAAEFEPAVLYAILNAEPSLLRMLRPELPPALETVVHKALEKDKQRRFQSMEALAAALKAV